MANFVYTKFFEQIASAALNWTSAVIRCMLERSTSTYSPNKDHDFVSDLSGFTEISVASYARQTLGSAAVNIDDANDRVELDCADISFGALESGQTVKSLIFYVQTGGNDSSPSNDPLVLYVDTATGLTGGAALGGGTFSVVIDTEGLIQLASA